MSDGGDSVPEPDAGLSARLGRFVRAVRESDEATVEEMVLRLSGSRRLFAPLAFVVGGFAMLFTGLKLLFSNWRLTLVQILPAMWIWLATYDLKAHVLKGKTFHVLRGPILFRSCRDPAITAASFFLNAIFGFAIARSGTPKVRPAFDEARHHLPVILGSGAVVGLLLGLATMVVAAPGIRGSRSHSSVVIGLMMVCYVAVPSRLIGVKPTASGRDRLTASAVGGAVGAVICPPPYVLGRLGILMLGSRCSSFRASSSYGRATLQAAATGAVKTVKMSAKLVASDHAHPADGPSVRTATETTPGTGDFIKASPDPDDGEPRAG